MLNISQKDQNQYVRQWREICMLHRERKVGERKTQRDENVREERQKAEVEKLTGA